MSDTAKPLHIVSLTANNILRIRAIEIVPNSNIVTLTGENEAGKSSVLNIIAMILGGADFVPAKPIRTGATKGEATLDLGDLVAELKFTASGKSIELRSKDNQKLRSPQSVLDSLWSKMCDPVRFIRLSETPDGRRQQAETLRRIVGLDFTKLDADRKKAYDERTMANGLLRTAEGRLGGFPLDPSAPTEEVSVGALMEELQGVRSHNQANATRRATFEETKKMRDEKADEIAIMNADIRVLEETLRRKQEARGALAEDILRIDEQIKNTSTEIAMLQDQDEKPIVDRISQADEMNAKVRTNNRRTEIQKEIIGHKAKVGGLEIQIAEIDKSKRDQLAAAKFPLAGLSFTEDGVVFNGEPFSQCSQAQQLKIATAIGLALNPRVRVVLIRDASLFDDKSRAAVAEMAKRSDAQVWLECVSSDDPTAIRIEDGAIKD